MITAPVIPAAARAGMEHWTASVAWALVPEVVTWRLGAPDGTVHYLKVSRLGQELSLAAERERLAWAAPRLPVPPILGYGQDGEQEWLLTAALPGVNATDDPLRSDPAHLVPLLATGLRRFHALAPQECPFDRRLEGALRRAEERVAAGLVEEGDLHGHGGLSAEAALDRLRRRRPPENDLVVCHGDYCLPNVLLHGGQVSGYVDLGALGVADRWSDLAVATWSVTRNLGSGWEDRFLAAYGVDRDQERIAYYRLLYDMLP